jgi:hypothetical protein
VPCDDGPAGVDASDKVYEAIEAGDHDSRLDQIDRAIKARVS